MIVTINEEDLRRAKAFHTARVEKINGIGLDTKRFSSCTVNKAEKRKELGIPENAFFVVSVGELKVHKNHEAIIRALAKKQDPHVFYGICGKGELLEYLKNMAKKQGVAKQVFFFGYRTDVAEILHTADLFAFPSRRDGLGLAALEAMASGLPLLTSNVGGIPDYVKNGITGFSYRYDDIDGFAEGLQKYCRDAELRKRVINNGLEAVRKYDIREVEQTVCRLMEMED